MPSYNPCRMLMLAVSLHWFYSYLNYQTPKYGNLKEIIQVHLSLVLLQVVKTNFLLIFIILE